MSSELNQELKLEHQQQQQLNQRTQHIQKQLRDRYKLLDNLTGKDCRYGTPHAAEFLDNLVEDALTHKVSMLQVIGEPGSGKSLAVSNFAGALREHGIRTFVITWVDSIVACQIGKPHLPGPLIESAPGVLSAHENLLVNQMYYLFHLELKERLEEGIREKRRTFRPAVIIGEAPGLPAARFNQSDEFEDVHRGDLAIRDLNQWDDEGQMFVAYIYATTAIKQKAKEFRQLWQQQPASSAEALQILEQYGIEPDENVMHQARSIFYRNGTTPAGIHSIPYETNWKILQLACEGKIALPRRVLSERGLDPEIHPRRRARVLKDILVPYFLGDEWCGIRESHTFIGTNSEIPKVARPYIVNYVREHFQLYQK